MLDIYIPGYKRPNAIMLRKLTRANIPFTIVLDHKEDIDSYKKYNGTSAKILFIEDGGKGIGYIRQKIKERYRGTPIMMMDDDTVITLRDFYNPTKLNSAKSDSDVIKWVKIVDEFCGSYKFDVGSCADSVWKYKNTEKIIRSGSLCSVTIFNSERVHEIDYDPALYKRMEDWDFILQAITRRFDFLICNEALRHCPMNKQAEDIGGCSEVYRDAKAMFSTTSYLLNKWGREIVNLSDTKKIGEYCDFTVNLKKLRMKYGYSY